MRARNIKPAFFQNEILTEIPFAGRLLFIGLWTLADREGRLEDRPKRIKMQLFAMDHVDVDELLCGLDELGFIERYRRDGGCYIQIVNFTKHQRPHPNESQSVIPPSIEDTTSNHGEPDVQPREEALSTESPFTESPFTDSLNADTGMLIPEIAADAAPLRPVPKPKPRNVTWDALASLCGSPATDDEESDFGKTVKQLNAINATPEEIEAFGPWWYENHEDARLTHRCLRRHFGAFRTAPARPPNLNDIKSNSMRSILTVNLEDDDDSRRHLPAQNGRSDFLPASPRRLGDGGRSPEPDVLPPPARTRHG